MSWIRDPSRRCWVNTETGEIGSDAEISYHCHPHPTRHNEAMKQWKNGAPTTLFIPDTSRGLLAAFRAAFRKIRFIPPKEQK